MDFAELFKISKRLKDGETEVEHRTAANRAFLFAYKALLHFFEKDLKQICTVWEGNKGTYESFVKDLRNYEGPNSAFTSEVRKLGSLLVDFKIVRSHADYDLEKPFTQNHAELAIAKAEAIEKKIRTLCDEYEKLTA